MTSDERLSSETQAAIVRKLAALLSNDEAGWPEAAEWIDNRSLDEGIDLYAKWESPGAWAASAVDTLKHLINPNTIRRFTEDPTCIETYETAAELFWAIFPDWKRSGI